MSYPPPPAGAAGFPPPPAAGFPPPVTPVRERAAALPGLAVLMLLSLVLELAILGWDLSEKGPIYLADAIGFTYAHAMDAPIGFFGGDTGTCVALLVMIIAAFTGRGWIRPAGAVLLAVNAYTSAALLTTQVTSSDSRYFFSTPTSHLLLNLDEMAQILIALVFAIVVAATRRPTERPVAAAGFPPPGAPYGYAPPPSPSYGYPTPPPQQPAPQGYPSPPPPPQPPAPQDGPRHN